MVWCLFSHNRPHLKHSMKPNNISDTNIITILIILIINISDINIIRLHRKIDMRSIAIDDHIAWHLLRERLFLLICQMAPLRCGHYNITVASCFM